jgi:competence protein ComEC
MQNAGIVIKIVAVIAISSCVLAWYACVTFPRELSLTMLDVGQGDALFIQTPKLQHILIDGGPNEQVVEKLGKHLPIYDRAIDLLVLTHPHADHLQGLLEVLDHPGITVKNILMPNMSYDSEGYAAFIEKIEHNGIAMRYASFGQTISFEKSAPDRVDMAIIHPFSKEPLHIKNANNTSVVMKLYARHTAILTGDAEKEAEQSLLEYGINVRADILKAGHHGSKTSSTKPFLARVAPTIALISAGEKNKFGHPHPESIDHISAHTTHIYRTDTHGDITIYPNREVNLVETQRD